VRRLLILSLLFVASSCGGGSGLSCHKSVGSIPVSVGSNLDASGVHHSVIDTPDDSPDQSSIPGDNQSSPDSTDVPDDQGSTTSLDLPDPVSSGGTTYFVIWNGKSYEPSPDCITVMWGRLCLKN